MFKKAYLCVMAVILALLPSILNAQAPDTVWTRRYNGPANLDDRAYGSAVDDFGNLYVTGRSYAGSRADYLTIKYNLSGDTLWTCRYNGPANLDDFAYGCATDSSGNLYVTGSSYNGQFADYLTVKYNTAGDTLWTRRYNGPANSHDYAYACAVDASGNIYVGGCSFDGTTYNYLTVRYNTAGDTLWTRRYNGSANYNNYDCAVDVSGNLYVTGAVFDGITYNYLTVKYNTAGDTLWTRRYNGPANLDDYACGCAVDSMGILYVTGSSNNNDATLDYLTIKYNAAGDTLWSSRYNGPSNNHDFASACVVDNLGNLYMTGESQNVSNYDYLTIKYNTIGDTLWTSLYNGPSNGYDWAYDCVVDGSGNLYVTGGSSNGTNLDYLTIKYNTATGVAGKPELPMTVSKLRLEQNRPNPFSQHTTISYQLPTSWPASLNIYNAVGQLVKTFNMGQQQAGHHQVEWSDSKITAGVYFYRLTAGNYQATKKLVVVK